jgi:hypothetical protein
MITKRACELEVGDLLDLEGDPYADPRRDIKALAETLAEVMEIMRPVPQLVLVYFRRNVVGFPPGHQLRVEQ